jgi:hypothetical protein
MKYTLYTLVDGLIAAIIDDDVSSTSSSSSTIPTTHSGSSLTKLGSETETLYLRQTGVSRKRTPKAVSFDESQNQAYENHEMYKEDYRERCWFSRKELKTFRHANKLLVDEILLAERNISARMRWGHPGVTPTYSSVMKRTFQACCKCTHEMDDGTIHFLTSSDEQRLHREMLNNELSSSNRVHDDTAKTRLGIERKLLDTVIGEDYRVGRRREMYNAVFNIQQMEARSGIAMTTCNHSVRSKSFHSGDDMMSNGGVSIEVAARRSAHLRAENIRKACQKHSLPSRVFAQQLALAHAASLASTTTNN